MGNLNKIKNELYFPMDRDEYSHIVSAFRTGCYKSRQIVVSTIYHLLSTKPILNISYDIKMLRLRTIGYVC